MLIAIGPPDSDPALTAAGESWKWQLRDSKGQWIEMGSEVKWLANGVLRSGRVTGSPKEGVATVRDADGSEHDLPSNRLILQAAPDKATGRRRLRGLVRRKTRKAQIEFKQTPAMEEAMNDMADIIITDVAPKDQDDAFDATSDVVVGKIAERLPKAQQALATVKALKERGTDAQIRLAVYIQTRSRLERLLGRATFWANEYLGDMGATDNPTPSWGAIPTMIGLPNPYSHPTEFLVESGRMFTRLLKALKPLVAGGDSWRWQLRDKNGKWIEMGSEVRWLAKGLYKQGIVIGSPSPGIAKVREHLTALERDIPSSRLQVVRSAADVLEQAIEAEGKWRKAGLTDNPALLALTQRAQETGAPLDWGEWLIPDEFASVRERLLTRVPEVYASVGMRDPQSVRQIVGATIWSEIRDIAYPLGIKDDIGPIYAYGLAVKIRERMARERLWENADPVYKRRLAPNLNEVRKMGEIATATSLRTAIYVLEEGRFQTQFETGESGGYFDPELRAGYELAMFGLHPDVEVERRPVYGYLFTPGEIDSWGVQQYGEVRFVLKPDIRSRTSITVGDSLGTGAVPVPLDGPPLTDKEAYMATVAQQRIMDQLAGGAYDRLQEDDYFEAQISGGVTTDDIAEIVIPKRSSRDKNDFDDIEYIERLAERYGIPVRRL